MSAARRVPLGELCRFVGGGTPSRKVPEYFNGSIPWATVKDFRAHRIAKTVEHISETGLKNSAANLVPARTVLVVTRVGLGKVAISDVDLAINQDIKALIPKGDLEPEYLLWQLMGLAPQIERMGTGATVKGITLSDLSSIHIPIPPLEEQRRIVDILGHASSIRRLREQAQTKAREIIPALFLDMFGRALNGNSDWETRPLSEVCKIGSGVTKGRKLNGHATIELPYLRVANVQDGFLDLKEIKTIHIRPHEQSRYELIKGDLLMTEGGDPDKLGRAAIWYGKIKPCIHQNHLFRVRPNANALTSEFLAVLISSSYGKSYFLRIAKRTTGIASINKTQLSRFPVILPPLELQQKFTNLFFEIEGLAMLSDKASAFSETISDAFLHAAFRPEDAGK